MRIKKGKKVVHHFAHVPPVSCSYATGESVAHDRTKRAIWKALADAGFPTKVECEIGRRRADVVTKINGQLYVVEVQHSPIREEEVLARMRDYASHDCTVVWVIPGIPAGHAEERRPHDWVLTLQQYGGGMVFHHLEGDLLWPVRYEATQRYVPITTWYNSDAEEQSAGGYHKFLKSTKTVFHAPWLVRVRDFTPARYSKREWRKYHARLPEHFEWLPKGDWSGQRAKPLHNASTGAYWDPLGTRDLLGMVPHQRVVECASLNTLKRKWCNGDNPCDWQPVEWDAANLGDGYVRYRFWFVRPIPPVMQEYYGGATQTLYHHYLTCYTGDVSEKRFGIPSEQSTLETLEESFGRRFNPGAPSWYRLETPYLEKTGGRYDEAA
jgi:competence protein CoiA